MPCVEIQGKSGHLQATERGLKQTPLTALRQNQPADTLISDL